MKNIIFYPAFITTTIQNVFQGTFVSIVSNILPVLVIIAIIIIIVKLSNRKNNKDLRLKVGNMLNQDHAANMARSKNINQELFYIPNISILPIKNYEADDKNKSTGPHLWQNKALEQANKKMLHFEKPMTNIELKNMFGAANLEQLANYEENFSNYMHTLRNWAKALFDKGELQDAQIILEESISAGSEASANYSLLADIYHKNNNTQGLQDLKVRLNNSSMPGKDIAYAYINKIMS